MSILKRHVPTTIIRPVRLKARYLFPKPDKTVDVNAFDFDGDGKFGVSDLHVLSKRHFNEWNSLGDGHCFFRVLDRFMAVENLYTVQELGHFKKVRDLLIGNDIQNIDRFPEICYLRRLCQKFCQKKHIRKYGREQEPSEDAMDFAADSQAFGLSCARNLSGTGARGYADTPDYAAAAAVLGIVICILQSNGKWQVFPDICSEEGFGNRPIMFAYNQADIHFNSLDPNIYKMKQRKLQINNIVKQMSNKISLPQACRIAAYFFNGKASIRQVDKDLHFIQKRFDCSLNVAIEMLYRRIPITDHIENTIKRERITLFAFTDEMFIKLLTYGNIKTKAGFNTASQIVICLRDKMHYIQRRDKKKLNIEQLAEMYLNGD